MRWISSDLLKSGTDPEIGHAALPYLEPRSEHGNEKDAWKISEALEVIETILDVFSLRSRCVLEQGRCQRTSLRQEQVQMRDARPLPRGAAGFSPMVMGQSVYLIGHSRFAAPPRMLPDFKRPSRPADHTCSPFLSSMRTTRLFLCEPRCPRSNTFNPQLIPQTLRSEHPCFSNG